MAIGISADLSTTVGITAAVEGVRSAFGPPEIVVAQTNDLTTGNFFDLTDEDFRRVFQIFTVSFAALARAVIPDMRAAGWRSEEHTSELQSLMRISYAVFCLKKKKSKTKKTRHNNRSTHQTNQNT